MRVGDGVRNITAAIVQGRNHIDGPKKNLFYFARILKNIARKRIEEISKICNELRGHWLDKDWIRLMTPH